MTVYNSRSVWLPAVMIVIFLLNFLRLNILPSQPEDIPSEEPEAALEDEFESELAKEPLRIFVPSTVIPPTGIPKDNPLNDIWHPSHDLPPANVASPEDAETAHQLPSTSHDAPPVQLIAEHTNSPLNSDADRPLISYAYSESNFGLINLKFFIMHALHDAADFIFILNGDCPMAEAILPLHRPNIQIVKRENTCFDLGAHAEVLNKQGENGQAALKHRYKRFILMNASIRGPFVPHWSKECWSEAYLGKVNERVKLVGSSLNCMGGSSPHVQSMIWATDSLGLSIILQPSGIGECFATMDDAMGGEIRTRPHLRSQGYEVDVMLTIFQTEQNYNFVDCKNPGDFLFEGGYYGFNVHPFETLFVKSHRGIDESMLDKLSGWVDLSGYSSYDVCK